MVETADLEEISERNQDKANRIRDWLVYILENNALPAVERAMAGVNLAHLGDCRPGVGLDEKGLPDIAWCQVPTGSFLMGSGDKDKPGMMRNPNMSRLFLEAYQISRYPVTHAQYGAFIQAGGYEEERYWTEAGWAWRKEENKTGPNEVGHPFGFLTTLW